MLPQQTPQTPAAPPAPLAALPPEPDFGGSSQAFQDLDIGQSPASSSQPASRFESKAVEPGGQASAGGARPDLLVTVTNPCMEGQGISSHFTYEVTTKTSLPQYAFGQFSVTRRFRDFDWLHAQLSHKYPGVIVPPLPEKQSATVQTMRVSGVGFSAEWLEERRSQLQRFLQRVVCHPTLHTAKDLETFLEAKELESWKDSSKAPKVPSASAMLTDVKSGLLSSYTRGFSMISGEGAPPAFKPVQDVPCQQMGNYAAALETQITAVHKHSKKYIERHRSLASSMTGFGLSLTQARRHAHAPRAAHDPLRPHPPPPTVLAPRLPSADLPPDLAVLSPCSDRGGPSSPRSSPTASRRSTRRSPRRSRRWGCASTG